MTVLKRCEECGAIITDDMDYVEGKDDPNLCDMCNAWHPNNVDGL